MSNIKNGMYFLQGLYIKKNRINYLMNYYSIRYYNDYFLNNYIKALRDYKSFVSRIKQYYKLRDYDVFDFDNYNVIIGQGKYEIDEEDFNDFFKLFYEIIQVYKAFVLNVKPEMFYQTYYTSLYENNLFYNSIICDTLICDKTIAVIDEYIAFYPHLLYYSDFEEKLYSLQALVKYDLQLALDEFKAFGCKGNLTKLINATSFDEFKKEIQYKPVKIKLIK